MGKESTPEWVLVRLKRSPVRIAREQYFSTAIAFAKACNVQWSVIYNTELCCFSSIPTSIWLTLQSKNCDMEKLTDEYEKIQKENRREFGKEFLLPVIWDVDFRSGSSPCPTEQVRRKLNFSKGQLSKGLCVQPATLYRLSEGLLKELPLEMIQALTHAGVDKKIIGAWNDCTRRYYQKVA